MDEIIVTCECGGAFNASRSVLGRETECPKCGKSLSVTEGNSRELSQAERDVRLFLDESKPPPQPAVPQRPAAMTETAAPERPRSSISRMSGEVLRDARGIAVPHPLNPKVQSASPQQRRDVPGAENAPQPFLEGHAKAKVPVCARCNKPFRGAWDQIESDEGMLCHICANKIDNFTWGAAPVRPPTGEQGEIMQQIARQYTWVEPPRPEPEDPARRRRHMMILAGIAVATITVALILPDLGARQAVRPQDLTDSWRYAVIAINGILRIATYVIALYCTLSMAHKLPNETFLANLLAVSIVAAIVVGVNMIPGAGYIVGIIVLLRFYELGISHLLMLGIFSVLAEICTHATAALIFQILGIANG